MNILEVVLLATGRVRAAVFHERSLFVDPRQLGNVLIRRSGLGFGIGDVANVLVTNGTDPRVRTEIDLTNIVRLVSKSIQKTQAEAAVVPGKTLPGWPREVPLGWGLSSSGFFLPQYASILVIAMSGLSYAYINREGEGYCGIKSPPFSRNVPRRKRKRSFCLQYLQPTLLFPDNREDFLLNCAKSAIPDFNDLEKVERTIALVDVYEDFVVTNKAFSKKIMYLSNILTFVMSGVVIRQIVGTVIQPRTLPLAYAIVIFLVTLSLTGQAVKLVHNTSGSAIVFLFVNVPYFLDRMRSYAKRCATLTRGGDDD